MRQWHDIFSLGVLMAVLASTAFAKTHHHEFVIQETAVKRLCRSRTIVTVNGQYPGPTLEVQNGDTLVIKTTNVARYNATLHWHGIRQMRTPWADGPAYVTQCPIQPGATYTYRFTIEDQEGTLWWHAHISWLRATVYGALIIYPKPGSYYPFPKPAREFPIVLGEWWNRNALGVVNQATFTGAAPNVSDAFTINGQPGDLYNCSSPGMPIPAALRSHENENDIYFAMTTSITLYSTTLYNCSADTVKIPVTSGETILLRVVNAALNQQLFLSVANHKLTVVEADAAYTKPFVTSVIEIGPGQTTNLLLQANQPPGRYYMAARAYATGQNVPFDNTTTTAIIEYKSAPCPTKGGRRSTPPILPLLPAYNDTNTVTAFNSRFRSLSWGNVPTIIDENLFFTVGLGLFNCPTPTPNPRCQGPNGTRSTASMNNVSFVTPSRSSILQSYYQGIPGVFTANFPPVPPVTFDYTGNVSRPLWQPVPGTEVYKLKYGSGVQLVLQDTNIVTTEAHPMHLHGYHFFVVGTGFGNFNPQTDPPKFNLIDPPVRNTIGVPVGGWSAIRFVADNPGVWLMHCHLDVHLTWGLAMNFLVANGVGKSQSIEPPPADLPPC